MFLRNLLPNQYVKSIQDITASELIRQGIRGIITDLDNTLVEWHREEATPEVKAWIAQMREAGIQVTVVSNNNQARVFRFCQPLGVSYIWSARKPTSRAFLRAVKEMNVPIEQTVVVGDQIFTDILGGNRLGFHTILVVPVSETDGFFTRFNRTLERFVLRWMRKKGMITWENKS
jgi:HAD superfamily phosphatase (TIGR01668 family)